jgi:hypothetical protein
MIRHEPSLAAVLWGPRLSLAGWRQAQEREKKKIVGMLSVITLQLNVDIVHLMINRIFDRKLFFLPIVSRVSNSGGGCSWLVGSKTLVDS